MSPKFTPDHFSDFLPTAGEAARVNALRADRPDVQAAQDLSRRSFLRRMGLATLASMSAVSCVKLPEDQPQAAGFSPHRFATLRAPLTLEEASKTLEVEFLLSGGADFARWGIGYMGNTTPEHANGPLKAPPPNLVASPPNYLYVPDTDGASLVHFLQKWGSQMLAVRSDHGTNGHEEGKRAALTGERQVPMPSTPVLRAKIFRPDDSLAYLHDNGMVHDGGILVGSTSIGNVNNFAKLAYPNLANPGSKDAQDTIFPPQVANVLPQIRVHEMEAVLDGYSLPDLERVAEARLQAQEAQQDVAAFLDLIKGANLKGGNQYVAAASIAFTLFQQGHLAGVSLSQGSYDTHNEADGQDQMARFQALFLAADQILTMAKQQGIPVRLVFKTDFGRRPSGNDISAHHPIGQTVFVGEGVKGPALVGVLGPNQDLVGEPVTIGDVVHYQRTLNGGLGEVDVGVPLKLSDMTGPHAVQDILDKQS